MPPARKCTEEQVLKAIRNCRGRIYHAARQLGVTAATVHNYAREWPSIREAVAEARGWLLDLAEKKLYEAIDRGEPWSICFILKTKGRKRGYIEKQVLRLGGDDKAPPIPVHQMVSTSELPFDLGMAILEWDRNRRQGGAVPGLLTNGNGHQDQDDNLHEDER